MFNRIPLVGCAFGYSGLPRHIAAGERGYVLNDGRDFVDRRREERKSLDVHVTLTCLSTPAPPLTAQLTDISTFGLGLKLQQPILVGNTVAVEWNSTVALGEIVYCGSADGDGSSNYQAGIRTDYLIIDRTGPQPENWREDRVDSQA